MTSPQLESLKAIVEPQALGSDLSVLIDKLKAWVANLKFDGLSKAALHALFHYITDTAYKKLKDMAPDYLDTIIDEFLIPAVNAIHDALFGPDAVT